MSLFYKMCKSVVTKHENEIDEINKIKTSNRILLNNEARLKIGELKRKILDKLLKEEENFKLDNKPKFKVGQSVFFDKYASDSYEGYPYSALKSFRSFDKLEDFKVTITDVQVDYSRLEYRIDETIADLAYLGDDKWNMFTYSINAHNITTNRVIKEIFRLSEFKSNFKQYEAFKYSYFFKFKTGTNPKWGLREDKFLDENDKRDKLKIENLQYDVDIEKLNLEIRQIQNKIKVNKINMKDI